MQDRYIMREDIRTAVGAFSNPDVYFRLMLASSPEAARKITESLPGVRELIEIGPDAGKAMVEYLDHEEIQQNDKLSSVALYILQRIPTEEAARPLAGWIHSGRFTGLNRELAADAFLASAGIETDSEDIVSVASQEAERFLL